MTTSSMPLQVNNRILLSLLPEVRGFLENHTDVRPIKAGDVIYENGTGITHAVFPHEGVISLMADMQNGRSVEKSLIGPEGFLGFVIVMGGKTALGRSVVQVAGHASWIPVEAVRVAMLRFECLRETLLRFAQTHIAQLMESLACTSLHSAEQRVSRWLLQAHDRVAGDTFHITQETVAMLLALRRATVNAVCTELMNAGAISYHRGALSVVDRGRLMDKACECYGRIRTAAAA